MLENNFIVNGKIQLYVRRIQSPTPTNKAVILFNSRSLCVESSMGLPMGGLSYGEYLASQGIETFLVDMRGYGMSSSIQEQIYENSLQVTHIMCVEDIYEDIKSSVEYVKSLLGDQTEITLVGFSYLGTLSTTFAHLYPDAVKNVIGLNPNWIGFLDDPERGFNFFSEANPNLPYNKVSVDIIQKRLAAAQPTGKDFREPTWAEEASAALEKFHKTFDKESKTWKMSKLNFQNLAVHLESLGGMKGIKANILFISSQYDSENPYYIVNRFFTRIGIKNKYLKILPNATHLCIWEKSRHTLYNWTKEFIL
jgi:pimeloyl-ACP methyl ester carboxylesterase